MLEIICAGSLAWSVNVCQGREFFDFALNEVKVSNVSIQDITLNREQLAKGKPYESEYRREADRDREQNEIINQDRDRDRIYRDADCYRRDSEYGEGDRDRIYRDADCYRRNGEYDEEERDRIYRNPDQYNRREGEYIDPEPSRDYRRDRSRINYESGYYRRR